MVFFRYNPGIFEIAGHRAGSRHELPHPTCVLGPYAMKFALTQKTKSTPERARLADILI